jgi:nucleoside-diphosphate-sugar epimerase
MRFVVTGATGFIGSLMAELLLSEGHDVLCPVRDITRLRNLAGVPVEICATDRLEGALAMGDPIDYVIHLAGAVRAATYEAYQSANVGFTRRLLDMFSSPSISGTLKRFVLVSSQAAAGPCRDCVTPVTESAPMRPVSLYGKSKAEAEALTSQYFDKLPITIVRPPVVFGPRDTDVLSLFKSARNRIVPYVAGEPRKLSIVYVHDLNNGILAAAFSEVSAGKTYFIANPEPVVWKEFGQLIARELGIKAVALPVPVSVMRSFAWTAETAGALFGFKPPLTCEKCDEANEIAWVCSTQQAKNDLGWEAEIPLEQAVRETYAWYRSHGWI